MTSGMNSYSIEHMAQGEFNWTLTTGSHMHCELVDTQPTQDHDHENDIAGELGTGDGYTALGGDMTLVTVAYAATYVVFDADDTKWSTFKAGPCRWAYVYKYLGDPATDPLFSFHDFGGEKTGGGGDFTVVWDPSGVARLAITAGA